MHPRIILAIARKDMLDVLRNRNTLMALLTPFFIAGLYWIMGIAIQSSTTSIAIYNPGHSALGDKAALGTNTTWNIVAAPSADAVRTIVDNNEQNVTVGLVIPSDADAQMRAGQRPAIQLFYHAAKFTDFSQQVLVGSLVGASQQVAGQQPPIQVQATALRVPADQQNGQKIDLGKQLQSTFGLIALIVGLISTSLMLVPTLLVEEKEKKTLRMILASPASYGDVIAGKLLVGFTYTALVSTMLLLVARLPAQSVPQVLLFLLLGGLFFLLIGLAVGAVCKTGTEVNSYASIIFMLALVPTIFNMPGLDLATGPIGTVVRFIPNYYLTDGMRRALEGTSTPESLLLNVAVTVGAIVVLFGLASWLLRRQQFSAA